MARTILPAGFTLFEVLLALAIFALLVGAVVVNMPALSEARLLEEGAGRFEAMVYMARAEAANLSRKLRLTFSEDEQGSGIALLWEADPINQPEQFEEYTACTWLYYIPADMVSVVSCQLSGQDAYGPFLLSSPDETEESENLLQPLTFYPDGTCDSAIIELVGTGGRDERRAIIEIDGLAGTVTRRIVTPSELEEEESQE